MNTTKILLALLVSSFLLCGLNSTAQKVAKVTISVTATQGQAIAALKHAGKQAKYGSKDVDTTAGTLTLWLMVGNLTPQELDNYITITQSGAQSIITMRMPRVKGILGSYTKELKKIVKHLALPNMLVGEYTEEIE